MNTIEEFWQWFAADHGFGAAKNNRLFLDLILAKLREINGRLALEMSLDMDPKEFIVSASGDVKLFNLIDEIVAHAPKMKEWRFISLKQPKGFDFTSNFRGYLFDPKKMWFMPLKKRGDPKFLGLRIGYEGGCDFAEKRVVRHGTFMVLDTGLGERVAATRIQYLEIGELPPAPRASGYGRLPERPEYLGKLVAA